MEFYAPESKLLNALKLVLPVLTERMDAAEGYDALIPDLNRPAIYLGRL